MGSKALIYPCSLNILRITDGIITFNTSTINGDTADLRDTKWAIEGTTVLISTRLLEELRHLWITKRPVTFIERG